MAGAAISSGSTYVSSSLASHDQADLEQYLIDGISSVALIVHSHIGFDSCIHDYVHARKFPILGPICTWALRVGTGLAVWGVYEFNTNDIGGCLCFQGTYTDVRFRVVGAGSQDVGCLIMVIAVVRIPWICHMCHALGPWGWLYVYRHMLID